ncbi:hypothetical protein [Jonesia quinghaiensis]|uniref:hypothetical protein n=1 Tax=Jonesia quinghaiensis TaxID=262806 RepID=UPI00042A0B61|nr:hypothetical protein [Jonesia quinghaiensis]
MLIDFDIDPAGVDIFLTQAKKHVQGLRDASPTGDGNLKSLADDAQTLCDPDVARLAHSVLANHTGDLQRIVGEIEAVLGTIGEMAAVVSETDQCSAQTLETTYAGTVGSFEPSRFASPQTGLKPQ